MTDDIQQSVETDVRERPPNRVTVCSRAGQGPYFVQAFERGRWMHCPGQWVSLSDATRAARDMRGVYLPSTEYRVISGMDIDRPRRISEFVLRLKGYELERRGLIRLGDQLRACDDAELDEMWRAKSRVARARERDPEPKPARVLDPAVGMMRILRLEFLGHDVWSIAKVRKMRPWVAGVDLVLSDWIGRDGQRAIRVADREFARGEFDYADADKTGGRGVVVCFTLRQGHVYEVFDRARRVGPRRVFMTHDGQCWHDLTPQEAIDAQGHARRRRADSSS